MGNISWKFYTPLKNENAIQELEQKYGFKISGNLRKIITEYNAGFPSPSTCKISEDFITDCKCLLSYNIDDPENIYDVIDYFSSRTHNRIIPFASDSGSGYYGMKGPVVVYVDDELHPTTIAESLDSFFNSLY